MQITRQTRAVATAVFLSMQITIRSMDTDYDALWRNNGASYERGRGNGNHLFDHHRIITQTTPNTPIPTLISLSLDSFIKYVHRIAMPIELSKDALLFLSQRFDANTPDTNTALYTRMLGSNDMQHKEAYYDYGRQFLAALLHSKADPNTIAQQTIPRTFLHLAAGHDDQEAIKILFDYKADPQRSVLDQIPLQQVKTVATAQLFIGYCQNIPRAEDMYTLALKNTLYHGYEAALIPLYIKQGAIITLPPIQHDTYLHILIGYAASYPQHEHNALLEKARSLLNAKPQLLPILNAQGQSALDLVEKLQQSTAVAQHVQEHYRALTTLLEGYL